MTPSRLGPYPIEREVGRGGMGVVYLARDTRLDRPIAIKVLPDLFARDPERLARFEREARLLASLNHANIAGIYGLEETDGTRFLALEYVEGETLAEHLARGPLTIEETLDVCRQIASALETAHEAGIVHRDLKPGNVKLTPAGAVKVLDFGLAKGAETKADSAPDLTQSPTLAYGATGVGIILGTAAYMSPEQARGKMVDRRTDIWSFGCVLYECLTGSQAFAGETVSDMIARILQGEPDWSKLPEKTPAKLRELLARCLEKDARRRLRDIGDARLELEELQGVRGSSAMRAGDSASSVTTAPVATLSHSTSTRSALAAAAFLVAGLIAGAAGWNALRPAPETAPFRFTIQAPPRAELLGDPNEHAISPDGTTLAFSATDSAGQSSIWIRPLASFEARELPGTRNAFLPFWSPDGKQVGFFADGKLKRVSVAGGGAQVICDAATGRGASWSARNVILFAPAPSGPIWQVPAGGGTPEAVTAIDSTRGETAHRWPHFLPDGEHFMFAALPPRKGLYDCYVASIRTGKRDPLLSSNGAPVYAARGHLVFQRNDALLAQRFDPGSRKLIGEPFSIGEPPPYSQFTGSPGVSVSTNGVLACQFGGKQSRRLAWIDRNGREIGSVGVPLDRWGIMLVSPDGKRSMIEQEITTATSDLWVIDLERGIPNRITYAQGKNFVGAWSHDGQEIFYGSNRDGARNIYRRAADGSGSDQLFYRSSVSFKDPSSCSPDGKWVVIQILDNESGWNLHVMPTQGGTPTPFLVTPFNEQYASVSPDGRWILYVSDDTGSTQAYVQSFPTPGMKQQVTKTGAVFPFWAGDGSEIFLLRSDQSVVSVRVRSGTRLELGSPRELYRLPSSAGGWAPAPDGQRFLISLPAERVVPGISIAVNWRQGIQE